MRAIGDVRETTGAQRARGHVEALGPSWDGEHSLVSERAAAERGLPA